jgi:predicted Holliday junction resolvase-like endonuclease
MCPHCGDILRLSDLQLRFDGECSKTWLDHYEGQERRFQAKLQEFDEMETSLRDQATNRGRMKVPSTIRKSMSSEFIKLRFDPYDIKSILHPVDFIVFNGMNNNSKLEDIIFLSRKTENIQLIKLRKSIEKIIDNYRYDWQVLRVDTHGRIDIEK